MLGEEKSKEKLMELFPDYFRNFVLPDGAHEESIKVYRACRSGKCDKASFLPIYEQNGFRVSGDASDPGEYSLSTYEKPNHIKLFATLNSDMKVPYKITIGYTSPQYGLVQRTSERKARSRLHIDWWLYKEAKPFREFEIIPDFDAHLNEYIEKIDGKDERI